MDFITTDIAKQPESIAHEVVDQAPDNIDDTFPLSEIDILLRQVTADEENSTGSTHPLFISFPVLNYAAVFGI